MVITSAVISSPAPLATSSNSLTPELDRKSRGTSGKEKQRQQALLFRQLHQPRPTATPNGAMPPTAGGRATMNNPDGDDNGQAAAAAAAAQHVQYGQQQQQQESADYNPHQQNNYGGAGMIMSSSNGVGNTNNRLRNTEDEEQLSRVMQQPTPLFERLVTEEVQELKAYARIIESQNRRLAELERVHGDLEKRLEQESRGRRQLEATLEERERQWQEKFLKLEKDRDHWKEVVQMEQTKNARLIEQVVRKDQDIQKMLQRKYDNPRAEGGHFGQSVRNFQAPRGASATDREGRNTPNSSSRSPNVAEHKSPHEILAANGSAEAVRARNVTHTLLDFFSLT